jgi:hypothetical protein
MSIVTAAPASREAGAAAAARRPAARWPDLWLLAAAIMAANLPLLGGVSPAAAYAFVPALVAQGEWWRVPAHVFAHISLYHLVLDAGAFLLLYCGLSGLGTIRRLAVAAAGAAGSTLLASLAPGFGQAGLCGLSGAAHGLMAVTGILTVRGAADAVERRAGWLTFGLVAAKAVYEAASGHVLFASWHLGNVGSPNPLCHLGGVFGSLGALGALHLLKLREMAARQARRHALTQAPAAREDARPPGGSPLAA